MKIHSKAKTNEFQRARLAQKIQSGEWSIPEAARLLGVSANTVRKWLRRSTQGESLLDRSSRRATSPLMVSEAMKDFILYMRRFRMTAQSISDIVHIPRSTVSRLLKASGFGKLQAVKEVEPVVRYEAECPGDLVHIDIKKLGRIDGVGHRITGDRRGARRSGWEYVFVAIDDRARVAYAEMFRAETAAAAVRFLHGAVAFFRRMGIEIKSLLTDNGSAFVSEAFGTACQRLRIRHKRTRPYRPQTNGKAERFIQTLLREWAYVRAYRSSSARLRALGPFLRYYNHRRPHAGIGGAAPISRLNSGVNNLVRNHS